MYSRYLPLHNKAATKSSSSSLAAIINGVNPNRFFLSLSISELFRRTNNNSNSECNVAAVSAVCPSYFPN
jgi:hypothetical protein